MKLKVKELSKSIWLLVYNSIETTSSISGALMVDIDAVFKNKPTPEELKETFKELDIGLELDDDDFQELYDNEEIVVDTYQWSLIERTGFLYGDN